MDTPHPSILWTCDGFRAVQAGSSREAAAIFAGRLARRQFGKRGYMRTLRRDSWTQDGAVDEYEAFIGYDVGSATCGHNERLCVRPIAEKPE